MILAWPLSLIGKTKTRNVLMIILYLTLQLIEKIVCFLRVWIIRISMYTVNTADVNKMTKNMHTLNEANYIVANPVDLFYVDTLAWKWERALATKPFICWFQENHGIVFSFLFKTTNIQTIGYSRDITWQMRHNQTLVVWPQTFSISLTMLECNVVLTITQNETFFYIETRL